ncbi:MAG: sodium:alanine symporter family protein [Cellvibrionales bacterium]|nr:sodium:alanine symporter family protein [Cellvibrionales bacterium]
MEFLLSFLAKLNTIVWGPVMLALLVGTGLFLTIRLKALPWVKTPEALKQLITPHDTKTHGDISPFKALMTSLSATIGTGNIAGVATAIAIGGPGAIFWMWISALFGMATKYAEAVLAVNYREKDTHGQHVGGPMYYIKNGLSKNWQFLAVLFSLFGVIASFGTGNAVQANSIADGLESAFQIPPVASGFVVMIIVGIVILGGIKRIGNFAGKLVPIMGGAYLAAGLLVIGLNAPKIPEAFALIFSTAFTGQSALGGFAGSTMIMAIQMGIARGVFSNESGLGSSPMAHAHASNNPVDQGFIAMIGPIFDTLTICTITALAIIVTGVWQTGETGAPLTGLAFAHNLSDAGQIIVAIGLVIFAFTTIVGWSIYGERCVTYLLGEKAIIPFRVLWVIAIPIGATQKLETVWLIADTFNALMALPNLIALMLLSPVVVKLTRAHLRKKKLEKDNEKSLDSLR